MSIRVVAISCWPSEGNGAMVTVMVADRQAGSTPSSRSCAIVRLAAVPVSSWSLGASESISPPG